MKFNTRFWNWTIFLILALIWGSSFILMKRGLQAFSSAQVAALRMLIAFLFLLPFSVKYVKASDKKDWFKFFGIGITGNFIPAFLFTASETGISSSLAGMLNSLTPIFTLILGVLLFRVKTTFLQVTGVLIGLIGAIGLLIPQKLSDLGTNFSFGGYVVIATLLYGFSVNLNRKYTGGYHSIATTCWSMILMGPLGAVVLLFTDLQAAYHHPLFWSSLGFIAMLAIGGTALSLMLFNLLIKNAGALFSASSTYLIPVVAIMWGVVDGEVITMRHLLSILVILVGVYLVNKRQA
ncbi:MAG TPA: DMT family transporter [Bacteroidia bacterium]